MGMTRSCFVLTEPEPAVKIRAVLRSPLGLMPFLASFRITRMLAYGDIPIHRRVTRNP
jgi:hypothetical protein